MTKYDVSFSLEGRTAVVTGGGGALGGAIARGMARAGADIVILGRGAEAGEKVVRDITEAGGNARFKACDVTDDDSITAARDFTMDTFGKVDILVNAAGGNMAGAVLVGLDALLDMSSDDFRKVVDLNLAGTILPVRTFARPMAEAGHGSIINISSMAAFQPMTRSMGYAAAKAGVDNATRFLAVHFAQAGLTGVRVNAIAPGFFLGEQNRALLTNPDGSPTERGQLVLDGTPFGRFGEPEELIGAAVWLASDAAKFVTGITVPVDGGFMAYSGV